MKAQGSLAFMSSVTVSSAAGLSTSQTDTGNASGTRILNLNTGRDTNNEPSRFVTVGAPYCWPPLMACVCGSCGIRLAVACVHAAARLHSGMRLVCYRPPSLCLSIRYRYLCFTYLPLAYLVVPHILAFVYLLPRDLLNHLHVLCAQVVEDADGEHLMECTSKGPKSLLGQIEGGSSLRYTHLPCY